MDTLERLKGQQDISNVHDGLSDEKAIPSATRPRLGVADVLSVLAKAVQSRQWPAKRHKGRDKLKECKFIRQDQVVRSTVVNEAFWVTESASVSESES